MNSTRRYLLFLGLIVVAAISSGCKPGWHYPLQGLVGDDLVLDYQVWQEYSRFSADDTIVLEQILYGMGARIIESIEITDQDGIHEQFEWTQVAESAVINRRGQIIVAGRELKPASILVELSPWESKIDGHIFDIAATAASALDIPVPDRSTGSALSGDQARSVLLLFLDGFGYKRYQESLELELIPELAQLPPPMVGLTTYPPVSSVSTASLLTGTEPWSHGAETRNTRTTDAQTLFDTAAVSGLATMAVEGNALAFNLRNTAIELSGDRDGNGGTDDNVLANTLAVLEVGMPDLFLVHFHGIDDLSHEVGPGAPKEENKIREVDAAVGEILSRLPRGTLVIIFADHGMHLVEEEGRCGNHGHLIPRDMLIPIWVFTIEE